MADGALSVPQSSPEDRHICLTDLETGREGAREKHRAREKPQVAASRAGRGVEPTARACARLGAKPSTTLQPAGPRGPGPQPPTPTWAHLPLASVTNPSPFATCGARGKAGCPAQTPGATQTDTLPPRPYPSSATRVSTRARLWHKHTLATLTRFSAAPTLRAHRPPPLETFLQPQPHTHLCASQTPLQASATPMSSRIPTRHRTCAQGTRAHSTHAPEP